MKEERTSPPGRPQGKSPSARRDRRPMSARAWTVAAGTALTLLLSACTVGPNYVRPDAPVPAAYKEEDDAWKRAAPRDEIARGTWWQVFDDAELDALARRLDAGNQDLRAAEARVRQARALLQQARAGLFPVLVGSATASRGGTRSSTASTYELALDAAWEPDLWGRVRRSIESSSADWQASAADLESVRLSAYATLAQSYFGLRIADMQKQLLEDTVEAYQRTLTLTQNRYAAGVAAKVDVVQAQVQLKSTQADLVDVESGRAQLEHAIAVLIGEPPANLSIARKPFDAVLPLVPAGLPSELLERRPDIAAAERRVAAANAAIGVAESAFYPSLVLSGATGFRSGDIGKLLSAPSLFWSLGAGLAQTLFDGGLRRGVSDQARAAYDGEVAAYRQTVLAAFQEVEDNLAALRVLEDEAALRQEALEGARQSVELTTNQYKAGTVSYLNVIAAQTIALNNERTAVNVLGRRLLASVALIKAVGGGWSADALNTERLSSANAERDVKPD